MKKSFLSVTIAGAVFFGCATMPMNPANKADKSGSAAEGGSTSKYQTTISWLRKRSRKSSL